MTDSKQDVAEYVRQYAPQLDLDDVSDFMSAHPKPDDQNGSHVQWAVRVLRDRGEGETGDGLSVDRVVSEIRRRDA